MDYEKVRTIPYGKILVRVWKEQLILTYHPCYLVKKTQRDGSVVIVSDTTEPSLCAHSKVLYLIASRSWSQMAFMPLREGWPICLLILWSSMSCTL